MTDAELQAALDRVAEDLSAGATDLSIEAATALEAWGREAGPVAARGVPALLRRLASLRPSMAPFLRLADAAAGAIERASREHGARELAAAAGRFAREEASAAARVARQVLAHAGDATRIGTYSAGATVREALMELRRAGRSVSVVLSESRPALEGVSLAERLAGAGIAVRLVTDAALPGELGGVEALWLGADALVPDGVIHKVGTVHLARAAGRAGVPVVVLAGHGKMLGPELARFLKLEQGDPGAIYGGATAGITAENPLFDLTPWAQIDAVFTEEGRLPAVDARRKVLDARSTGALTRLTG